MKKYLPLMAVVFVVLALSVAGCAQQPKSEDASGAIEQAKMIESAEAQVKYLVKEANAFINSAQFDEAINTAKYILNELDAQSIEAKNIIEKAQAELTKIAEEKMAEAKSALGSFGQ